MVKVVVTRFESSELGRQRPFGEFGPLAGPLKADQFRGHLLRISLHFLTHLQEDCAAMDVAVALLLGA